MEIFSAETNMNFENKVVLITGASSGIGKAIALQLLREKCRLILLARRIELLEELVNQSQITNNQPLIIKCDVSKKNEVASAYKVIKEKFGSVDVAILNSGVGRTVTVDNYDSRFAEETFGANFFGIVYWVEQLLPDFVKIKKGMIVGVSSLADNRGYSGSGFYCASKAAVSIYFEGLRVELKRYGIKVITVKPGFVKTPMTAQNKFKMPFLMEPEEAAQIIIDGIKREKRIIQFPWQMALLTRIVGLIPGSLYEWLASKTKV
ncbi:MAG: SDR family NAD(P)-dependent oxidoreductase [Ignavibacteriales bacterium]|nr:SDR family NAD(P)-dependent oxidoreductase [Ignavibacteriales bacterium]